MSKQFKARRSTPARKVVPVQGQAAPAQVSVDDITITRELASRSCSASNPAAEAAAMSSLAATLMESPGSLLDALLRCALEFCRAGSAGISLLEGANFKWVALEGAFASHAGGTTPRSFSPCGTTLDRGCSQLFSYPERVFTYLAQARPVIVEGLVVPFQAPGIVGTLWIVSHDENCRFTSEDARVMLNLAGFAAAALALQRSAAQAQALAAEERTARLAADAASHDKDRLLATVSHELRTPLNAILGWSELLLDGSCDISGAAEAIESIYLSAGRQARLVENLLDGARTGRDQLALNCEPVALSDVARRAFVVMAPAAAARRIDLRIVNDSGPCAIHGDPDRLQQIALNLLANAVKFTPAGGRVLITVLTSGPDHELRVDDSGPGVDGERLSRIFEGRAGGPAARAGRPAGLGLGLPIVHRLVSMHGGVVAAGPSDLGGARFVTRFPALFPARPLPTELGCLDVAPQPRTTNECASAS